jgi:hypothetical protein
MQLTQGISQQLARVFARLQGVLSGVILSYNILCTDNFYPLFLLKAITLNEKLRKVFSLIYLNILRVRTGL